MHLKRSRLAFPRTNRYIDYGASVYSTLARARDFHVSVNLDNCRELSGFMFGFLTVERRHEYHDEYREKRVEIPHVALQISIK